VKASLWERVCVWRFYAEIVVAAALVLLGVAALVGAMVSLPGEETTGNVVGLFALGAVFVAIGMISGSSAVRTLQTVKKAVDEGAAPSTAVSRALAPRVTSSWRVNSVISAVVSVIVVGWFVAAQDQAVWVRIAGVGGGLGGLVLAACMWRHSRHGK